MIARQLTLDDCQAVANLETQLFDGRFDAAGLCALLGKPAFYGAVCQLLIYRQQFMPIVWPTLRLCRQILLLSVQTKPCKAVDMARLFYSM